MSKKTYLEQDANLDLLSGQTVAVVGYGTQGTARAMNMKDSGLKVIVGADKGTEHWTRAAADGFEVMPIEEAAKCAYVFDIEVPDMAYRCADVYERQIKPHGKAGDMIVLSSAFNYYYGHMPIPDGIDAIVAAPKGPGSAVRGNFLKGSGVPGLLAVHKDSTGNAWNRGLALCKAIGFTRVGVQETTIEEETVTDLLGEHCSWGAIVILVKTVFEVMVEEGYDPEVAFFEAINESKLTTDLIYKFGMAGMLERISNTAAYGAMLVGPRIIDSTVKEKIRAAMHNIKDGGFDKDWKKDYESGYPDFNRRLKEIGDSQADVVGNRIRQRLHVLEEGDFKVKNV
ncbi:MAG: ketol-acid reductoisomerase [Armatimonadetes bacterium]|nr:ketol-acid reductoisomerase [Armatimonadota bacterium]